MANLIVAGDAVAADVASGKKFCAGVIYNGTGTSTGGGGGSEFTFLTVDNKQFLAWEDYAISTIAEPV